MDKIFIKDEVEDIKKLNELIKEKNIDVIILSGGTGLTGRDSTPEAVKSVIKKRNTWFWRNFFRFISFKKIATSALQSRALAGLANDKFVFSLPGSPGACKDAWDEILIHQLNSNTKPCNLVELIPRLNES